MKVKVISLPNIFQVMYALCFTRPRYQVSVYRTIGPLVSIRGSNDGSLHLDSSSSEETFNLEYMRQKLEHGLVRIWQDVQQKVRTYILGINLSAFKLEEFIQFLDLVNR